MRNHLFELAERMEQELGEERSCVIEGCEEEYSRKLGAPAATTGDVAVH